MMHEICHAIGLFHEHQRPDRDNYVTIKTENTKPNFLRNFEKKPDGSNLRMTKEYDFLSIRLVTP